MSAISRPSGELAGLWSPTEAHRAARRASVRWAHGGLNRRSPLPSGLIDQIQPSPSRGPQRWKAIRDPSGAQSGSESWAPRGAWLTLRCAEPSAFATKISAQSGSSVSRYRWKAILPFLAGAVAWPAVAAAAAATRTAPIVVRLRLTVRLLPSRDT